MVISEPNYTSRRRTDCTLRHAMRGSHTRADSRLAQTRHACVHRGWGESCKKGSHLGTASTRRCCL
eukprot:701590-Rhodomonas_salina.2